MIFPSSLLAFKSSAGFSNSMRWALLSLIFPVNLKCARAIAFIGEYRSLFVWNQLSNLFGSASAGIDNRHDIRKIRHYTETSGDPFPTNTVIKDHVKSTFPGGTKNYRLLSMNIKAQRCVRDGVPSLAQPKDLLLHLALLVELRVQALLRVE